VGDQHTNGGEKNTAKPFAWNGGGGGGVTVCLNPIKRLKGRTPSHGGEKGGTRLVTAVLKQREGSWIFGVRPRASEQDKAFKVVRKKEGIPLL